MSFLEGYFGSPSKRTFTDAEAQVIEEEAENLKGLVKSTKKGFKALTKIVNSQAQIHGAWREHQIAHAEGLTEMAKMDAKTFKRMGSLAPQHAKALGEGQESNNTAQKEVDTYARQYQGAQLFGLKLW